MTTLYINGIGILAPGIENWPECKTILTQQKTYQTNTLYKITSQIIPAKERRRASRTSLIAAYVAEQAVNQAEVLADQLSSVFSSYGGDLQIADKLCTSLADNDPFISPIQFHNSVHNAPAGCWSIATQAQSTTTSLAGSHFSFQAALLESVALLETEDNDILLACYDSKTPEPLNSQHTSNADCGVALILSKHSSNQSIIQLSLSLTNKTDINNKIPACLKPLITANASMQSLILLDAIANKQSSVILDYLDNLQIKCLLKNV